MAIPLSNEIRGLLDGPNFAHLATLMPDGSPQSVPVWVGREGDRILICTGEGSLKAKNTRRDPRVALSLVDFHDPYQEAQLRGHVVERRPDGDFKYMDAISHKYTGKPFPFRSPEGRVALVIEIEKARYTKLPFENIRRPSDALLRIPRHCWCLNRHLLSGRRMKREHFVKVVAEVFDSLPQKFRSRIRGGLTL